MIPLFLSLLKKKWIVPLKLVASIHILLAVQCHAAMSPIEKSTKTDIQFHIRGAKNETLILGYYYASTKRTLLTDSMQIDGKGQARLLLDSVLPEGVYFLYLPKNQELAEILIGKDQEFSLVGDTGRLRESLACPDLNETRGFLELSRFYMQLNMRSKKFQDSIKAMEAADDVLTQAKEAYFKKYREDRLVYIRHIEKRFGKESVLSLFANLTVAGEWLTDPRSLVPDTFSTQKAREQAISRAFVEYQLANYWGKGTNPLTDPRSLRTPIFEEKYEFYLRGVLPQHPDTFFKRTSQIINQAEEIDPSLYRFLLSLSFSYASQSKLMGMYKATYLFAVNYYLNNRAPWISQKQLDDIRKEVSYLQYNLIGNKGIDIRLTSLEGTPTSLFQLDAKATMLIFWDPSCAHCKKIIPQIKTELYDKYHDKGFEVFAVLSNNKKMEEWKSFIARHKLFWINALDADQSSRYRIFYDVRSSPTIYMLNQKKEIITKNLDNISVLKNIIENETRTY